MDNDALVAALGVDAVAAVHGYRLGVLASAAARGFPLCSAPLSPVVERPGRAGRIDPIDIRLAFGAVAHPPIVGRVLSWCPATGWSARDRGSASRRYLAARSAAPLDLVPTPAEVLDWATTASLAGHRRGPAGVDLDDDPRAIARLLSLVDPGSRARAHKIFSPVAAW